MTYSDDSNQHDDENQSGNCTQRNAPDGRLTCTHIQTSQHEKAIHNSQIYDGGNKINGCGNSRLLSPTSIIAIY